MIQTPLIQIIEALIKRLSNKNLIFASFISALSIYSYNEFFINSNKIRWENVYEAAPEITELRNYLGADSIVLYKFENHPGLKLVQVYKNPRDRNIVINATEEQSRETFEQYDRFNCVYFKEGAIDKETGVPYYRFGCPIPVKGQKIILEAYFLENPRMGYDREAPYDDTILTPLFKSGLEIGKYL